MYQVVYFTLYSFQWLPNSMEHTTSSEANSSSARQDSPYSYINPLSPKLNPICNLLALLGAHHFLHVSRIRVKLLTFRRLM